MAAVLDVDEVLDVLRRMDMLSEFTPEQLRWVADHGVVVDIPAGQTVMFGGDADAGFWLLMAGTRLRVSRPDDDGREVPTGSTDHVGAWGGRIPLTGEPSPITMRAETDARFLRLSDDDADTMLASGMPLGRHLIAGIQIGHPALRGPAARTGTARVTRANVCRALARAEQPGRGDLPRSRPASDRHPRQPSNVL